MENIAAIIIWYNPKTLGQEKIIENINSYSSYFSKLYIIDNSKDSNQDLADKISNSKYIQNFNEHGIAGAQNKGCEAALKDNFKWAITLDQDSLFKKEELEKYLTKFNEYRLKDDSIKSFSIKILNNNKPIAISKIIRFKILSPIKKIILGKHYQPKIDNQDSEIIYPLDVIASGNIISLETWEQVGKFDNYYFIDEVDSNFCHKLLDSNYKIIRFNNIFLEHCLGEKTISLFEKHTGNHNNFRLFYIFRNCFIERYRYQKYRKEYNKRIRNYLFDTIINSIHPLSHLYIFFKAYFAYKKYIKSLK